MNPKVLVAVAIALAAPGAPAAPKAESAMECGIAARIGAGRGR